MDEFPGLLAKDFGFRPQGKAAPMAASKGSSGGGGGGMSFGIGSDSDATRSSSNRGKSSSSWSSTPIGVGGNSFLDDQDGIFGSSVNQKPKDHGGYDDVFGGPPKYSDGGGGGGSFDYDSIFHKDSSGGGKRSNSPVFDKPVYDDDIFDGVPGLKPTSKYEDVFSSISSPPKKSSNYDDLLGDFGVKQAEPEKSTTGKKRSGEVDKNVSDFDDLLPGFGGSSPPKNRTSSETRGSQHSTVPTPKTAPSVVEDPFVVLESASARSHASSGLEPLEQTDKPSRSGRTKSDVSSPGGLFDDMDPLSFAKSVPSFSSEANNRDRSHSKNGRNTSYTQSSVGEESTDRSFAETAESFSRKKTAVEDYRESHQTLFDMPTVSTDSHKAFARNGSRPYANASPTETHSQVISPKSEDNSEAADDVWLTVSEIPLFTQPTSAPPPSRPPPPRPGQSSKTAKGSFSAVNSKNANEFPSFSSFSQNSRRPETIPDSAKSSGMPSMDELEDFSMGRRQSNADERGEALSSGEDVETNSAAATAAMKEAMDRAEVKFKHAREMRERENAKVVRNRGVQQDRDEKATQDAEEREHREKQERLDRERREREDKEREQKRLEKERERAREIERGKARQAVERATKEARDRAAVDARQRAAFEKAKSEARDRERAAVQRAHAEARERAAAEARERAERAAAEAKERANSDAREKVAAAARAESEARRRAERAAADRAAAEARERAAAEAREKATAAARGNQNKSNENDLESFFGMGNRPSSAPKSRTPPTDPTSHPQFHNRTVPEGAQWSSTGTSSTMRKASSTTNIVDDLTSIFGGTTQSSGGEFQDIEGETEERRRARLERHQRTQERAKKALAEKNERDLQNQRDQAERHRIAETLDVEIKRWAAGKEGNLRALLSTLQYVLWPECGWQPISLTDLITSASVKKAYRKATLCIHPDKVQQKGANLQQKYIAEKVFDLLKECKLVKAIECQLSNSSFSNLL